MRKWLQAKSLSARQIKEQNREYFRATVRAEAQTAQLMKSILESSGCRN
jgi:hypothetical protein